MRGLRGAQRIEVGQLTPKQVEVVQLICQGYTSREIAEKMGRSFRTVEVHRFMAKKRLGATTTADLLRKALERGIVTMTKGGGHGALPKTKTSLVLENGTQRERDH